jgi:hypothetical protein
MTTPVVDWPSRWTPTQARDVAACTFALLFNTRRWVHRRTELISFIDENSTRRHISVDFTLPELPDNMLGIDIGGERIAYVPLTLLRKRVLSDFSLCDEEGRTLPLLTRTQNADIAVAMLLHLAQVVLDTPLLDDVREDLQTIAGPIKEAEEAFERLNSDDATHPSYTQRRALLAEPRMRALMEDFVHSFLFLVPMPAQHGKRRIIKFSYEEEPGLRVRPNHGKLHWLTQTVGCAPISYLIPSSSIGDSASFHAEIFVPEELEITRTRTIDLKRHEVLSDRIEPVGAQRVHVYSPNEQRTIWGLVEVSVLVARKGLLMASVVVSLLTSIMLTTTFLNLTATSKSTDAASAFLLAIPAIFSGYLLRPDEHPLVTKLFAGLRMLVLTSGLCALVACGLLIIGVTGKPLHTTWEVVMVLSWIITLLLSFALYWPRRKGRKVGMISPTPSNTSSQGLPPASIQQALAYTNMDLAGFPIESAEGWRSGFTGLDSEEGISKTLQLAMRMRASS